MASQYNLRVAHPALILVTMVAVGLGAGYYFASANQGPTVTWSQNPLFIALSPASGSGSAPDSFTCSSPVGPVTLSASSNQPSSITLTVSPTSFPNCGSTPDNVVVTATCTPTAKASSHCVGGFSGKVVVCGPTSYTCLKRTLIVVVNDTAGQLSQNSQE